MIKKSKVKSQKSKVFSFFKTHHSSLTAYHFKSGQLIIISLIFLAVVMILSASLFGSTARFLRFGSNSILREQATSLAEAGVDNAIWQLNKTVGSCPSPYCGTEQVVGTTGSFIVTIQDKTASLKTITATGYVPNATTPRAKRTIKADTLISSETIAFHYAVQTGTGGVFMANSSRINGTVYSNGSISGTGSSVINGEAYAVGSISSPYPTIMIPPPHPNASPQPMPITDTATWYQQKKQEAQAGGETICPGGTCTYTGGITRFNTQKYTGNIVVQNAAQIIIDSGPIWVTGNITVQNTASSIKLNDSFGSNGVILISDGKITTQNSGAFIPTNANPKGYILAVSTSTVDDAVNIQNSGVNAIFYAFEGGATLQNSAQATALVANKLSMQNSATLNYDSGLASAQFSAGPGGSWQVKKGTYRFTGGP